MTHSYGVRSGTRQKFAKGFRRHGSIRIKNYLTTFRKGEYVDILVDGAIHKGMPYQFYHGRTGRVFNVNPRSVGVALYKEVGNRKVEKRVHVRVEHLRKSSCRLEFIKRVKSNDLKKQEANKKKQRISTKRQPAQPREATVVIPAKKEFQHPKKFVEIY